MIYWTSLFANPLLAMLLCVSIVLISPPAPAHADSGAVVEMTWLHGDDNPSWRIDFTLQGVEPEKAVVVAFVTAQKSQLYLASNSAGDPALGYLVDGQWHLDFHMQDPAAIILLALQPRDSDQSAADFVAANGLAAIRKNVGSFGRGREVLSNAGLEAVAYTYTPDEAKRCVTIHGSCSIADPIPKGLQCFCNVERPGIGPPGYRSDTVGTSF